VRSGLFPLYEVFDGERYRINARPDGTDVAEYLGQQRRFAGKQFDVEAVRRNIAAQWRYLEAMEASFPQAG
jgi:pyruvate ferredoxin oxidoreductase beta subunit/2-oxoisovalerate ferredoxin oxidoreductase beta subunit